MAYNTANTTVTDKLASMSRIGDNFGFTHCLYYTPTNAKTCSN